MAPRKWIDKKTAQNFTLVHRPQNDPLIHDESAPTMVLNPTSAPNAGKGKKLDDLASEFGGSQVRDNEGEAANHGVYFDDTEYDYMQHMRDLGDGAAGGDVVFVDANAAQNGKGKGKQKQSLDDALRQLDLDADEKKKRELLDEEILPSKNLQRLTYQDQQDVPDAIGRFDPDMDPNLREVLEALEDEAFVDEENDDEIFQALTKDGRELEDDEFGDFDDDDGWESDATAKPAAEYKGMPNEDEAPALVDVEAAEEADQVGWLADFKQFKKNQKSGRTGAPSDVESSLMTTTTNGGRRKKRKGALTSQSGYSMTSSSLVRTEQLSILDARFEKLDAEYSMPDDEDGGSVAGSMMSTSSVSGTPRSDLNSIMDEFLSEDLSMQGKKREVRTRGGKTGLEQLDDIRRSLGPARINRGKTGAKKGAQKQAAR